MRTFELLYKLDSGILLWSARYHCHPMFIKCVRGVSRSGDGYLQLLFPLLLWRLDPGTDFHFIKIYLGAFACERAIYFILKNVLKRQRPPQAIEHFESLITASDLFSFPSGHTMAAFLLAGIATLTLGEVAAIFYVWAAMVGASRVILGVHFPSDILAGAALGSCIAITSMERIF